MIKLMSGRSSLAWVTCWFFILMMAGLAGPSAVAAGDDRAITKPESSWPPLVREFVEENCRFCHDSGLSQGGLDLSRQRFDLEDPEAMARWVQIYDRVRDGEMPPEKDWFAPGETDPFLKVLAGHLTQADGQRIAETGRAQVRRLNRSEYQQSLSQLLNAPWLLVADDLPADGMAYHFSKVGSGLDISHVQIEKYLEVGQRALRTAVNAAAYPSQLHRYYARREKSPMRFMKSGSVRFNVPIIGWETDVDVIAGRKPDTAWDEPEIQAQEAVASFYGPHPAYVRYDFTNMDPPIDGRYLVRVKSYSVAAGKNGYGKLGIDPTIPAPQGKGWYWPNKLDIRRADRDEPIMLFALRDSGDTRWLADFDAQPDPHVVEREVILKAGDNLRPDAARLVRLRPGWDGNPNALGETIPGWAVQWIEVEGPISEAWPPESYRAVFGDLRFEVEDERVRAISEDPREDARRLLSDFAARGFRGREVTTAEVETYLAIFEQARDLGLDFTDAMLAACNAVLASPKFLFLTMEPGRLDRLSLAARLSYFLTNGPPDAELLQAEDLTETAKLREQAERLLDDPQSEEFLARFLDEWLDLRDLESTAPDAVLYPDYFLDSQLVESARSETRRFVGELVAENLPARNLIDSEFTFVNERLARHYGIPHDGQSIALSRVELPEDSPRGGLMTQASVLKVTANGTTTSPVLRGVWVVERLLGREIPDPPSGVEAIEPDTRGATTIGEQLDRHKEIESCGACHRKFDPVGFALESFDVLGGWRDRYRALGETGETVEGFGLNGHAFEFRLAQSVECQGQLEDGQGFADIQDLKALLQADERGVARNLVGQLVVYATGAPVSFADREAVEAILDSAQPSQYGVRDLILGLIQSDLFRQK